MKCKECDFWELYKPEECGLPDFNWKHNADIDCPALEDHTYTADYCESAMMRDADGL